MRGLDVRATRSFLARPVGQEGDETMIASIYARKSTEQTGVSDDQKSVTRQVEHTKDYARTKGWTVRAATERNVMRMLGVCESPPTPVSPPAHSPAQERDLEEWPG